MLRDHFELTRPLVVFDLETTGVVVAESRIVQIGLHVFRPDGPDAAWHSLINPNVSIPKEASDVHGITDEVIATGCAHCWRVAADHPTVACQEFAPVPSFRELAPRLHHGFSNADFGGYNVEFDLQVIAAEFKRCNLTFTYESAAIIDAFRIWQAKERRTLENAAERFARRKLEGAHHAMHDVTATVEIIAAQVIEFGLPRSVNDVHASTFVRQRHPNAIDSESKFVFVNGEPCLNFGKFKGVSMRKCTAYLKWMASANFSPEIKKIVEDALKGVYPAK